MKEFYVHQPVPDLLRKMESLASNTSKTLQDICKKSINYRAKVIFRLATDTMTVTTTSKRLSFFDKLSGFGKNIKKLFFNICKKIISGGILGLFTGMSILSMVELTFWIVSYFTRCCKMQKGKINKL